MKLYAHNYPQKNKSVGRMEKKKTIKLLFLFMNNIRREKKYYMERRELRLLNFL